MDFINVKEVRQHNDNMSNLMKDIRNRMKASAPRRTRPDMSSVFKQINSMNEVGYEMLAYYYDDIIGINDYGVDYWYDDYVSSDAYYQWISVVKKCINYDDEMLSIVVKDFE